MERREIKIVGVFRTAFIKVYSCTNVNAAVQSLCPIIIVRLLAILKGVRT